MASAEGDGERPSMAAAVEQALSVFPILVRVMGAPPPSSDDTGGASPPPPPDRIVLLNPLTQSMVVLRGHAELIASLLNGAGGLHPPGPPPASKASIESLKIVSQEAVSQMIDDDCPVCLDGLLFSGEEKGEEAVVVKEMPCGHGFHGVCIEKWLGMHGSCPVCRFQMPAEDRVTGKNGGGDGATEGENGDGGERGRRGRRELWVTVAIGRRDGEGEESQTEEHPREARGDSGEA